MQSGTQSEQGRVRPKLGFLPSLNGGRGIAAVLVFGGHYLAMQFATPVGAAEAYGAGERGATDEFFLVLFGSFFPVPMDFFFIVSGFVLAWAYRPEQAATEFWRRRFGKVYPVYVLTSLMALVLFGLMFAKWASWKVVLSHIFLLQAWSPDHAYVLGLNPVMWTLSSETFNYLMFPALMVVLVRFSDRALRWVIASCVAATFLLPVVVGRTFTLREPAPPVQAPLEGFDNAFTYWFTLMCPIPRLFQFVLGIAIALLMLRGRTRLVPNVPVALVVFLAGLVVTLLYVPHMLKASAGMLIPVALLIAALAKADLNGRWSPLRSRPMMFLGKISYSFYAVHILFILFTIVQIPVPSGAWDFPRLWLAEAGVIADPTVALPGWANIGLFLIYLFLSLLAGWLLYAFVEQPLNRAIRGRGRGAPRPPAPAEDLAFAAPTNHLDLDGPASSSDGQPGRARLGDPR